MDPIRFDTYTKSLPRKKAVRALARLHGLRYLLTANVLSNIRMKCRVHQSGFRPGAILTVRARVTENGQPVNDRLTTVTMVMRDPDGAETTIKTHVSGRATYDGIVRTVVPGIYSFKVVADGLSRSGQRFLREHTASGAVWHDTP